VEFGERNFYCSANYKFCGLQQEVQNQKGKEKRIEM